ncbi:hypothetical protein [Staphylospora marina]|uniref:hypothetical protein n=1 Tax=Staphylospora marina TaxID=2490858 RepID=UPI000F5BDB20|nr:hypothetical protein [Staphylospora marina]
MFFGMLSLNLVLYIVAVLLFREGEYVYAWAFLGAGVLLSGLILFLYHRRKEKRDSCDEVCDSLFYCGCDAIECADCVRVIRGGRECSNCDCFPGS